MGGKKVCSCCGQRGNRGQDGISVHVDQGTRTLELTEQTKLTLTNQVDFNKTTGALELTFPIDCTLRDKSLQETVYLLVQSLYPGT